MTTLLDELDARLQAVPSAAAPLRRLRREYTRRLSGAEAGKVLALAEGLLERGGSGDAARTLGICRLLVEDRDDMVVKAMSWALRELAKRDPGAARRFLAAHRHVLAPRVVREVGNKLATGLKNPRRHPRRRPA